MTPDPAPLQRLHGPGGVVLLVRREPSRVWYRVEGIAPEYAVPRYLSRQDLIEAFDAGHMPDLDGFADILIGGTFTAGALDRWCRGAVSTAWLAVRGRWD